MGTQARLRLSIALLSCVLLGGCSLTTETPGAGGGRPTSSPQASAEPSPEQLPTEPPAEPLDETEPLPPGPPASDGEVLSSDLSTTNAAVTMHDFLVFVLNEVDTYWTGVFAAAGYPEPVVNSAFPAPGEQLSIPPACTADGSGLTDDSTAQYCTANDSIIVSQALATDIWTGAVRANTVSGDLYSTGDFSVAYVVAHEYAHSLQAELNLLGAFETYKIELHADCWAGVWANSAYYAGILEPGDVEEAFETTRDIGDYEFNSPAHHGTPEQRSAAFMAGYGSGVPSSCDAFLASDY